MICVISPLDENNISNNPEDEMFLTRYATINSVIEMRIQTGIDSPYLQDVEKNTQNKNTVFANLGMLLYC